MTSFRPLHDHLLLKRLESEEKSPGGIIVPDVARVKSTKAKVIAAGPGKLLKDGTRALMSVIPGDVVVLGKYAGADVEFDGEKYVVVEEGEVLGVQVDGQ